MLREIRRTCGRCVLLVMGLGLSGCAPQEMDPGSNGDQPADGDLPSLEWRLVHRGLSNPVDLQSPPDGSGRLFIVEQVGRIRISDNGTLQSTPGAFLDIRDLVDGSHSERGLLGLAFHPDFASNGRFFVNYTASGDNAGATVIAEFTATPDLRFADAGSRRTILEIDQPFPNHNGGQLQFGPDGALYVGTGDGGSFCDPQDNAQDPASLLGKMLRLDVDNPPTYIPQDNPLLNEPEARDEIWALGLRNPWRFSFDPQTGLLYIADVGQRAREEVNIVRVDPSSVPNFGWRTFEGTLSPPSLCAFSSFIVTDPVMPVEEYSHDSGCAVTGGYVYRGAAIPALDGVYFYSDFCSGAILTFRFEDGAVSVPLDLTDVIAQPDAPLNRPTSFGVDGAGELYVLDRDGDVFRLEAASLRIPAANGVVMSD